ncbi:polyhydroxyalkanoate synthase [Tamilnaduibacter salinus]|uniref:Polyhydroxyalkanoate synthase n=1 Tax=Tamilnaduibacter salinus TaxID=1484056 RepID=A0A2U1CYL1_9GAMM|nr:alpha/beta fold hydrolase [Tamilnaduibacter salinus]PVY77584.1 polyhydroxyalkanoate synthase [Tamilnaduibacter salinus]
MMKQLIQSAVEQTSALGAQAGAYASNAFDRVFRAASLVKAGQTPFETLESDGLVSLRYYPPLEESYIELGDTVVPVEKAAHRTPIVIVPPLAVNMLIYDLFPNRSLVRYLRARGFEVYLIDWGMPTRAHSHYNLHTYVAEFLPYYLNKVREHSGEQELSLHGWSLGGMFTLFYAGLSNDQHIRNAIILGSPIDSHASGFMGTFFRAISGTAEFVREHTPFRLHNVKPHWLHTPGWANTIGFKMTNPVGSVMGYWELLAKLGDREFVTNHATTSAFLDRMVAYPGGVIQDTVVRVWIDNQLSTGEIQIGDDWARLENVTANLYAVAGQSDTMVTPGAAKRVMDHVRSTDKTFRVSPGGHMGILAGSRAPEATWVEMADWLGERSG